MAPARHSILSSRDGLPMRSRPLSCRSNGSRISRPETAPAALRGRPDEKRSLRAIRSPPIQLFAREASRELTAAFQLCQLGNESVGTPLDVTKLANFLTFWAQHNDRGVTF